MAKKYFGTDGIRGRANQFPITADNILKVAMTIGSYFQAGDHRHRVVIGKDTRLSGYMIENALTSGFTSVGMDVFLLGPVPTPAVSMLTKSLRADIGIMISASHNPYYDNGIKIFDKNGEKLPDEVELEIEKLIDDNKELYVDATNIGKATRLDEGKYRYIEFAKNTFPKDQDLSDLKVVIDCANGAAYAIAPKVLWELGANVVAIGNSPDGYNINENCGSTSPEQLSKAVLKHKADIGIALDGDADRLVIVDEKGSVVEGDKLIALIAEKLHDEGSLKKDTVVITHMSNLALENHLAYMGINTCRVGVGDRYILEEIKKSKYNFGAEQSGHIVLSDHSTTGDGLVSALQVLAILKNSDKKMSQLANCYQSNPQKLKNIDLKDGDNPLDNKNFKNFVAKMQEDLGNDGRIFIRKSGTQNMIRILVEHHDEKMVDKIIADICAQIN